MDRRSRNTDEARARAAEKAKKTEARAATGAEARAAYDARAKAVAQNTERLKALRLARDAADVQMRDVDATAGEKTRRKVALTEEPAMVAKARDNQAR